MNVLKPTKRDAVLTLLENNISQHQIARDINVDRKTIRKYGRAFGYIEDNPEADSKSPIPEEVATGFCENPLGWPPGQEPVAKDSVQSLSACEKHRDWIEEQVRLGRNAMAIFQDMVELFTFGHKYNSVKRFVNELKKVDPEQYDRLEFLPGEEAQVDFGEGAKTLDEKGKYRRPRLFVMTLKYSGRSFRKTVWKASKEIWSRLHEEAFRHFGGCPQYVVLDNLKEGVIKPDLYEPEMNAVYAAMLAHYGVVADPARVGDPDRKGTVERAIGYTQDTGLKGRTFESIEKQNEWLMHWEERWASKRIHGTFKRQVSQLFEEEKPHLHPLPVESFRYFEQGTRTVWDDGFIQVHNSYYSAIPAPIHSIVTVRIYDRDIEIIDTKTMEVIRRHEKSSRPGSVSMKQEDRIFNPSRDTDRLLCKAEKIGAQTRKLCGLLFEEQGRLGQRMMYGITNLARKHEAGFIEKASVIAIDKNLRSFKAFRRLVECFSEEAREQAVQENKLIQEHRLIRPSEDYATFWNLYADQNEKSDSPLEIIKMQGGINSEQING